MDGSNCDNKVVRAISPDKRSITTSVGSYASVLKGREKNKMSGKYSTFISSEQCQIILVYFVRFSITESDKCRDLSEAIEYPQKTMFEDVQFPPVTSVHAE